MKHIYRNIALGVALLPMAAWAQVEEEYTDSVASQVNVAFRTVSEADLMGGISTVNMVELSKKNYSTDSLDVMDAFVGGYNGRCRDDYHQAWPQRWLEGQCTWKCFPLCTKELS